MSPQASQALSTIKQVLGWVALAFAICALAKLLGFHMPIPGTIEQLALVGIACRMA